jgi:CRISPR/Cas system CMR subunit Cmr4 (Cas7 group RAMP superfamily)
MTIFERTNLYKSELKLQFCIESLKIGFFLYDILGKYFEEFKFSDLADSKCLILKSGSHYVAKNVTKSYKQNRNNRKTKTKTESEIWLEEIQEELLKLVSDLKP